MRRRAIWFTWTGLGCISVRIRDVKTEIPVDNEWNVVSDPHREDTLVIKGLAYPADREFQNGIVPSHSTLRTNGPWRSGWQTAEVHYEQMAEAARVFTQ
jgi:hypothetical protein